MHGTVYGYIRLEDEDHREEDRVHDLLAAHAAREGLALADVFVDRNTPSARIVRPGLTELLARLQRTEGSAVLIPDLDHLSTSRPVRQAITAEIGNAGGRMLVVGATPVQLTEPRA